MKAARERVRERQAETALKRARVASQGQEMLPQSSPTGNTSTAYADSGTGFHNSTSDHPDRTRRYRIVDMMSAWMSQLSPMLEHVELSSSGIR